MKSETSRSRIEDPVALLIKLTTLPECTQDEPLQLEHEYSQDELEERIVMTPERLDQYFASQNLLDDDYDYLDRLCETWTSSATRYLSGLVFRKRNESLIERGVDPIIVPANRFLFPLWKAADLYIRDYNPSGPAEDAYPLEPSSPSRF